MSGGVDSAVALLRAGADAIGVTLRLWIDPDGPDTERACCSPEAVIAARETCHALGLPHVTLDLREEFRRAVVEPFVARYARGETPNPCIRCNGCFRFAELLAFARAGRRGAARDRPLRADRRARRPSAARARGRPDKDQSYMLARLDPRFLERLWFPLGEQDEGGDARRGRAAGLAAASAAESQEACFLAGDDYRRFLERHGLERGRRRDRRRGRGASSARHDGLLALHARPAPRASASPRAEPLYALAHRRGDEHASSSARAASLAARTSRAAAASTSPSSGPTPSCATARPRVPARVEPTAGGFRLELDEPAYGVAAGQAAVLYERRRGRRRRS